VCCNARVLCRAPFVCCSVLQCVAVCCSVLQCVALCCSASALQCAAMYCKVLQGVARRCRVLQCVAVRGSASAWQCVAACCSVLQCVAVQERLAVHIDVNNHFLICRLQNHCNTLQHITTHCKTQRKGVNNGPFLFPRCL